MLNEENSGRAKNSQLSLDMKAQASGGPAFRIFHGDCVPGMRALEKNSVDVVVTSPPYNIGIAYSTYKDKKSSAEFLDWCEQWAQGVRRVLKPDGAFFLNLGNTPTNPFFAFEVAQRLCGLFVLQNTIHWIKSISIDKDEGTESYGHFKPINSERYLNDCQEYVFHFTLNGNTRLDRLAVGSLTRIKAISADGHTREVGIRGVAEMSGSSPIKQFVGEQRNGPIRRPFPQNWQSNVFASTGKRTRWSSTLSWALAMPHWRRGNAQI